jgi:hypothetical protein
LRFIGQLWRMDRGDGSTVAGILAWCALSAS